MGGKQLPEPLYASSVSKGLSDSELLYSLVGPDCLFPTFCSVTRIPLLQQRASVWISYFNWRITRVTPKGFILCIAAVYDGGK